MCDIRTPWITRFRILRPIEAFPRLEVISAERRTDASYHLRGRDRTRERHCIFKYTLAGEGRFADADGEHVVGVGRGFLCEIRDPETSYYYPPNGDDPWTFVYVAFSGRFAVDMVRQMTGRFGPVYALDPESELVQRLCGYAALDGRDVPISAAEAARLVTTLLTELAAAGEPTPEDDRGGALVRRAIETVRRRLGDNFNAEDLADALDISREHLSRTFRRQTGQSPYQYIRRQKMLLACRLLKESDLAVKQVAAAVGFSDPAHFNRVFRTVVGSTPSRFRREGLMPAYL